ncbi:hypothetical protein Q8A73_015559 [Channa argus]|nr:hypothetical protein Q8A73_015559 [Channa argus]
MTGSIPMNFLRPRGKALPADSFHRQRAGRSIITFLDEAATADRHSGCENVRARWLLRPVKSDTFMSNGGGQKQHQHQEGTKVPCVARGGWGFAVNLGMIWQERTGLSTPGVSLRQTKSTWEPFRGRNQTRRVFNNSLWRACPARPVSPRVAVRLKPHEMVKIADWQKLLCLGWVVSQGWLAE